MATADSRQANDFPANAFPRYVPHQPQNVPPAPFNAQYEGHQEDIHPPVRGVAGPGGVQGPPHYIDAAYQGVANYHPQPLGNPAYVFPDVEYVQGAPVQVQPNSLVNQERDFPGHMPQHVIPDPPQAAFPHPFDHRIPTPNQQRAEDLRQLAGRYWYHPNGQVGMVSVEASTTGRYKVIIILETPSGF